MPERVESDQPLVVDFVNTRRAPADHADLIGDYEGLAAWLGGSPPRSLPERRLLFGEAHRLRDVVHELLAAISAGQPPHERTIRGLDRILSETVLRPVVARSSTAPNGVETTVRNGRGDALGALQEIAMDAARLAAEVDPERLRRCAAPDCPRWFVDSSRGGRRKWCSMKTCGNRNKVARFRSRQGA